jgi:pilus assembly protein Flp/PilA
MRAVYARLLAHQAGVTAIEYGLIAALVALAAIAAWSTLGSHLSSEFNSIASSV